MLSILPKPPDSLPENVQQMPNFFSTAQNLKVGPAPAANLFSQPASNLPMQVPLTPVSLMAFGGQVSKDALAVAQSPSLLSQAFGFLMTFPLPDNFSSEMSTSFLSILFLNTVFTYCSVYGCE
jgi:hypothetical protein